jgi:integrase
MRRSEILALRWIDIDDASAANVIGTLMKGVL